MKQTYFAQFYQKSAISDETIEACGDRSVTILDGRESLRSHDTIARHECAKRGYIAYSLHVGTFMRNSTRQPMRTIMGLFLGAMFGNLGTHVINFPSGRWGFVGSLPITLGEWGPATTADVLGCRVSRDAAGALIAPKFPVFDTEADARAHAAAVGVALNN